MSASYTPHKYDDARSFENGCRGKVGYTSKRQATGRLRVMHRDGKAGLALGAYHCRACHRWHLGNSRLNLPPRES